MTSSQVFASAAFYIRVCFLTEMLFFYKIFHQQTLDNINLRLILCPENLIKSFAKTKSKVCLNIKLKSLFNVKKNTFLNRLTYLLFRLKSFRR